SHPAHRHSHWVDGAEPGRRISALAPVRFFAPRSRQAAAFCALGSRPFTWRLHQPPLEGAAMTSDVADDRKTAPAPVPRRRGHAPAADGGPRTNGALRSNGEFHGTP